MNKQILKVYGITEEDFKNWCIVNNKKKTSISSKSEFLKKIYTGELVKDDNGNLIKKQGD